jgi:hypothetical protein
MSISGGLGAVPSNCWAALEERMRQWGRLTFDIVNPRQADDPLNSSNNNRYLTVFFASRPDGALNILAERNQKVHQSFTEKLPERLRMRSTKVRFDPKWGTVFWRFQRLMARTADFNQKNWTGLAILCRSRAEPQMCNVKCVLKN